MFAQNVCKYIPCELWIEEGVTKEQGKTTKGKMSSPNTPPLHKYFFSLNWNTQKTVLDLDLPSDLLWEPEKDRDEVATDGKAPVDFSLWKD